MTPKNIIENILNGRLEYDKYPTLASEIIDGLSDSGFKITEITQEDLQRYKSLIEEREAV